MRTAGEKKSVSDLFLKDMPLLFPVNTEIPHFLPPDTRWKTPPRVSWHLSTSHILSQNQRYHRLWAAVALSGLGACGCPGRSAGICLGHQVQGLQQIERNEIHSYKGGRGVRKHQEKRKK